MLSSSILPVWWGKHQKNFCCLSGWFIFPNWNLTILDRTWWLLLSTRSLKQCLLQEMLRRNPHLPGRDTFLIILVVLPFSATHNTCPLPLTLSDRFWMCLVLPVMKYSSWGQDLYLIIFEPFMSLLTLLCPSYWLINFNLGKILLLSEFSKMIVQQNLMNSITTLHAGDNNYNN